MTIDEAVKERQKVIEVQEKLYEESSSDESKGIIKSATDNDRQLVEWLKELKEAKRLLKSAVEDLEKIAAVDECSFPYCDSRCPFECIGQCEGKHWKHLDEALKLIGETNDEP